MGICAQVSEKGCSFLGERGCKAKKCKGGSMLPGQKKGRGWRHCWAQSEENDVLSKLCSACTTVQWVALPQGWGPTVRAGRRLWPEQCVCLSSLCFLGSQKEPSCCPFNLPEPSAFLCTPVARPLLLNWRALPYLTILSAEHDPFLSTRCPSLYMSNSAKSLQWKTRQGTSLQIKKEKIKDWWQNVTVWAQV